jgi:hypothetical protein
VSTSRGLALRADEPRHRQLAGRLTDLMLGRQRGVTAEPTGAIPLEALPPLRTRLPVDRWAPVIIGLLATAAMLVNLARWPRVEDDEGTYVGQADAVFSGTLGPYTYIYDHPFLAWVQMAPLLETLKVLGFGDVSSIFAGRLVIALFGGATAALIYLLTRRIGGLPILAVLASVIWMTSGLVQDSGRAVYLDNIAVTWLLLALYLALSPRQAMRDYVAAGIAFAVAVLSKETTAVMGPAVLLAVWQSSWKRLRVMHVVVFLVTGALVGLSYPLFAALKGELFPSSDRVSLLGTALWQLGGRDGSGFLWLPGSDRQQIVTGWLGLDAWLLIVGVLAGIACLAVQWSRPVGLAVLLGLVPPLLMDGYLPPMYHLVLLPLFAVAIAFATGRLAAVVHRAWRERRTFVGFTRLAVSGGLVAVLLTSAWAEVPQRVDRMAMVWTSNGVGNYYEARQQALSTIPLGDRVLTNGEMWNDFADAGWAADEVVPYTKVDRDPELNTFEPEWIVLTPTMARDVENDPEATRVREFLDKANHVVDYGEYHIYRMSRPHLPVSRGGP